MWPFSQKPEPVTLHRACGKGDISTVAQFIADGADVNLKDKRGRTPLCEAVSGGRQEVALLLLQKGADPNISDEEQRTPLHVAVATGKSDCVECLIQHGATIDAQAINGVTPLHVAVTAGLESMVAVLLNLGANPSLLCRVTTRLGDLSLNALALARLKTAQGSVVHERILSMLLGRTPP